MSVKILCCIVLSLLYRVEHFWGNRIFSSDSPLHRKWRTTPKEISVCWNYCFSVISCFQSAG